jgi:hypothetical protein
VAPTINKLTEEDRVSEDVVPCLVAIPHEVDEHKARKCDGQNVVHLVPRHLVDDQVHVEGVAQLRDEMCVRVGVSVVAL